MEPESNIKFLVTGGTGYIASWIIKYLLEGGYSVNTTVRNAKDDRKITHLINIEKENPGRLRFFDADLNKPGSFDDAMANSDYLIHSASPFRVQGIKNPMKELIEPAVNGTANVLGSALKSDKIKRVVLTSSVASVYGDNSEIKAKPNGAFTEDDWNETSNAKHQPYSYSKKLAEKKAWEIAKSQDQWDLVTINPGFVIGPSLSKRVDGTSVNFILSMADGRFKTGIPDLYFGLVDVRDVARAHILAATGPSVSGRYILVSESMAVIGMSRILTDLFDHRFPFPKSTLPKWLFYLIGPFMGFSYKYVRDNVGIPLKFDNSKSIKSLGINYKPVSSTLKDHIEQLVKDSILIT